MNMEEVRDDEAVAMVCCDFHLLQCLSDPEGGCQRSQHMTDCYPLLDLDKIR